MRVLSCNSAYGSGGIGQHFAQLVEESRQADVLEYYYSPSPKSADRKGIEVSVHTYGLVRYTPLRFFPAWKNHILNELFDYHIASRLSEPSESFMGFAGKSLRSFRKAQRLGFSQLELIAPNSHVENVYRLHERASRETGINDSWLNHAQVQKTISEYELADRIYTHSEYTAQSLIDHEVPSEKLSRTHLTVDPRFRPPAHRPEDDTFRIIYVGRVDATKGVPLLIEAFKQLPFSDAELRIVGGWSTRVMRTYMNSHTEDDERITVAPGDPLPALQEADVFVHPTYEDGFGYAPMEALACGTPVVVTEDTGMKEHVRDGQNGYVIPTGDVDALLKRLDMIRNQPLARTTSLIHDTIPAPNLN